MGQVYEIRYRARGNTKMYKKIYECSSRSDAKCRINIEHCQGKLEGVKMSEYLKIESVNVIVN